MKKKLFVLFFVSMFFVAKCCYAKGLFSETSSGFSVLKHLSSTDDLKAASEASGVLVSNTTFPLIKSCVQRCFLIGNLTCSAKIRDILLDTHCCRNMNGARVCDDDPKSPLNPFLRDYLLEIGFYGVEIKFIKCENR